MFKDQEETEARYDELGRSPSGCLSYSSLVIAAVGGYKSGVEDKNGRAQHVIKWMKRRHDMGASYPISRELREMLRPRLSDLS
jgi:hypothetical protein